MASREESRRDFLKKGAVGLAGMALASPVRGARAQTPPPPPEKPVITRTLGRTGIEVPIVSMGARFDQPDQIRAALDSGIRLIDTADTYGNGRHEEAIGEAVKGRPRDSFVIVSKVYTNMDAKTGLYPEDTTPESFTAKFEGSLERLGLDHVDILMMHDVVRGKGALCEPLVAAMQKEKKSGRARFIGLSTHANEPEVINAVADAGIHDVVLTSYNFLIPHIKELDAAIDRARAKGIGFLAMKTQAGVYWDRERTQQINMKAALKWALGTGRIDSAIPGFANFEEMEIAQSVMEGLDLTEQELKDLKLTDPDKASLFCPQCGECLTQCRADLDIPTLMRGYMYAYGYRNPAKAKNAVRHMDLDRLACDDCPDCRVTRCTMGFDVRTKVRDIARIGQVPDDFLG